MRKGEHRMRALNRSSVLVWIVLSACLYDSGAADAATRRRVLRQNSSAPWQKEREWSDQATGKLAYGLKNTLLGWTEIATEPYEAAAAKNGSIVKGIGEGIWNAVGQTIGGAVDVLTFPATGAVVPLPEGGIQLF